MKSTIPCDSGGANAPIADLMTPLEPFSQLSEREPFARRLERNVIRFLPTFREIVVTSFSVIPHQSFPRMKRCRSCLRRFTKLILLLRSNLLFVNFLRIYHHIYNRLSDEAQNRSASSLDFKHLRLGVENIPQPMLLLRTRSYHIRT